MAEYTEELYKKDLHDPDNHDGVITHLEPDILEDKVKWALRSITVGKTLSDISHSRILYDPPPRILEIKAKINKWDLIKLKSFCTMKETISKVKNSLQNGRK